jgi:hypothetical protein
MIGNALHINTQDLIPEFIQLMKKGKKNLVFAHTENALEKLSTMYQETWIRAASGAALPGLPFVVNSRRYHRTIKRKKINPTTWEIYSDYTTRTGLGVTSLLEQGHGPIDLKPGLLRGPKSRQGKNGRYNIVAYRQGVPGSDAFRNSPMPMSVYKNFTQDVKQVDAMKQAGASKISGTSYSTKSSSQSDGRSYNWGIKYDKNSELGKQRKVITKKGNVLGEYTHKSGRFAGMVRMQQSTSKSKRGAYMTFRVVSAMSDPYSWIVPEQDPWPVRQSVKDFMKPIAEGLLQEAMEADLV